MKHQMQKVLSLFGTICLINGMVTGCGQNAAPSENQVSELTMPADSRHTESPDTAGTANSKGNFENAAEPDATESTEGKWHVLPPEVAAAVDADFEGDVWKIEENAFYIVEQLTELLDDGSILSVAPSTDADISDTELVCVTFNENTHFYTRTIYDGGARYKDTEASFQDIKEHLTVEMKGHFENDVFCADEIRIVIAS